ncbi:ATP-binding cassette subfamily C protein [Ruminiclostridium sufflavum DSM 19573]|uniref:ATP-binding cassette subfamily C protein n=1 Tax=Ruminiclostridium sufflavum DSM 19573 TaxID=1121337 RepID=A0A318XQ13_9FIRM|nr:ABC transporter ATP-binding protein [Ruminiclostridium sufflavum]PYG89358.1 ATP-binding cassette subfamily C protein [Ruminiclostridium sufflavum DSM 19573]
MGKWKSLLKLKPFLKKYRLILFAGIVGIILSSVLTTPVPYFIGHLLDKVLMGNKSYHDLYLYVGVIAALYLLDYGISLISKNLFVRINNSVVNEMRYSVMGKVMDLPMSYLSNTEKGYVQGRISECSSVGGIFSPMIVSMLLSVISAMFAAATMFVINYKLALVVLALTPVFFFSSKASTKGFVKNTKDMMESSAVLNGECFEIMNGIEDIKVLGGKEKHLSKFQAKISELVHYSVKQSKSMILFVQNISLINNAGTLLILLISGILILKGQFTIGLYTSFSLYSVKVFASTQGIATLGTTLKPICLSIERIYELLDMKDENSGKDKILDSVIETIEFEQVGFRYKDNLPDVFREISFHLQKGDSVLLEGENGSGKTTLIKLLLGLYQPTSGIIVVNGLNTATLNCDSLRQRIGVVSQNIFLFRGTVLDNILYGQNEKTRQDVQDLVESLSLQDYIGRLTKGLDTEISQNTSGVSGGQAQIIAFIRALLSQKDAIILDEPISNVDAETRNLILHILKEKKYDGILIVISHQTEGMDFLSKVIEIE